MTTNTYLPNELQNKIIISTLLNIEGWGLLLFGSVSLVIHSVYCATLLGYLGSLLVCIGFGILIISTPYAKMLSLEATVTMARAELTQYVEGINGKH